MECLFPPPVNDDDISAAIEGHADSSVMEHLQKCPSCRARFEQELRFEQKLKQRLYRLQCVSSEQLRDYFFDLLSDADRGRVKKHVDTCPRCQEEMRELETFMGQEQSQAETPRPHKRPVKLPSSAWLMKPIVSQQQFALRGNAPLMLETHGITLLLSIDRGGDGLILIGRIVAENLKKWIGALVQVQQQGIFRTTVLVDKSGVFRSPLKEDMTIELRITAPDRTILQVKDIDLRP